MQKPVPFEEYKIRVVSGDNIDKFRTKNVRDDLTKKFLDVLKNSSSDYLIMDNHFEVDAGIIELNDGTLLTHNNDIKDTLLYEDLNIKRTITMQNDTQEYLKLYSKYCNYFFEFLNQFCPNIKVILNVSRWVPNILKLDGRTEFSYYFLIKSNLHNKYRYMLDKYILDNFDVDILPFDRNTRASNKHWGYFHPCHFEESYLDEKNNQLKEIIFRDKLLNSSFELKQYNKKIRFLRRKNLILTEENSSLIKHNEHMLKMFEINKKIIPQNIIFYDKGIENNKSNNYCSLDGILFEITKFGTKVYSNSEKEGFYYINQQLDKDLDYMLFFTWVGGNFISPIIQIRETLNMSMLITFQKQPNDYWGIYTYDADDDSIKFVDFAGHKLFERESLKPGDKIKLIKKGNNIKLFCSDNLVIDYDIKFHSNFYIGFGGHASYNRNTIYLKIY